MSTVLDKIEIFMMYFLLSKYLPAEFVFIYLMKTVIFTKTLLRASFGFIVKAIKIAI